MTPARFSALCLAACILVVAWISYMPGLKGTFLFDDAANLPALGATGPIDNGAALARYLTSGKADPTGRPVALASFLIDSNDWPASPYPFKRSNLIIHLLNGVLLGVLLAGLGRTLGFDGKRNTLAAIIGASIWLLHPMLVSTVLYVVQREAMLPATFLLLAGLCWLYARDESAKHPRRAAALGIAGIGALTALAALSKANGLLVPLLILVCEWVLPAPKVRTFRKTLLLTLGPIAAAVALWIIWCGLSAWGDAPIPIRGWSVTQRLLTEPSILFRYLGQLWLVLPVDSSLLHDGIRAASGPFSPWYTFPAILGCIALVTIGVAARKRYPVVALAIVFFFAGHLMESTSLALELYFDHRNYIPSLVMFWPVAIAITGLRKRAAAVAAGVLVLAIPATLTYGNAKLWGNPIEQAYVWAHTSPSSARAQAYAAQTAIDNGDFGLAFRIVNDASLRFHGEPQIALTRIDVHCAAGELEDGDLAYAQAAFRDAQREPGPLMVGWFEGAVTRAHAASCRGLTREALTSLLDAAMENPRIAAIAGRRQDIVHVRGAIALAWNEPNEALALFDQALSEAPTPQAALSQAASLGAAGYPALGLRHLDAYAALPKPKPRSWRQGMPWLHDEVLEWQGYWPRELTHLRATLQANAAKSPPGAAFAH